MRMKSSKIAPNVLKCKRVRDSPHTEESSERGKNKSSSTNIAKSGVKRNPNFIEVK